MMTTLQHSFWDRLVGVVTLQRPVYEALRRDPAATAQAWLIVLFLGLANGIAIITTPITDVIPDPPREVVDLLTFDTPDRQVAALLGCVVLAAVSWYLTAWLLRVIGGGLADPSKWVKPEEMRRLIAWGYAPSLASFLAPIPIVGALLPPLGSLWALVTGVMAVRTALGVGIGKAILIEIVAYLILAVIAVVVIALVFAQSLA
jgi:hypothetical protein